MKRSIRNWIISLVMMPCIFSLPAVQAQVAITDTVTVGAYEFAQPADFTGLTWDEMNTACPDGDCDAGLGQLNGFDLSGWRWATLIEISDLCNDPVNNCTWYCHTDDGENHDARTRNQTMDCKAQG